jgi:hypothetical protein
MPLPQVGRQGFCAARALRAGPPPRSRTSRAAAVSALVGLAADPPPARLIAAQPGGQGLHTCQATQGLQALAPPIRHPGPPLALNRRPPDERHPREEAQRLQALEERLPDRPFVQALTPRHDRLPSQTAGPPGGVATRRLPTPPCRQVPQERRVCWSPGPPPALAGGSAREERGLQITSFPSIGTSGKRPQLGLTLRTRIGIPSYTTWKVSGFRSRDAHDFYAGITISNTS